MKKLVFIGVAGLALALGVGLGLWRSTPGETAASPNQVYATQFPDLGGTKQALSQWRGKVLVLNFWATWCPPCRAEIPDFIAVSKAYQGRDVAIVGIALDEPDAVGRFAKEFGISYPLLVGGDLGHDFAEQLGNNSSAIPFTAILDREGRVAYVHLGELQRAELERQLGKLL